MSEAETDRKFDAIVDFADIGKFLDTPVGHYSSGMFSRLGFAVAVHIDSDIFLVDEVLAVGDRPFKKKCMARMQEIRDEGRTMLYVSHAADSVRKMCDRVLVLEKGVLGFDGPVDEGIRYLHYDDRTRGRRPEDDQETTTTRSSAPTSDGRSAPGSENPQAGLGKLQVCSSAEALASSCDCCDIWYSCESRPHRSTPAMPENRSRFVLLCQQSLAFAWWSPSRPRRRTW